MAKAFGIFIVQFILIILGLEMGSRILFSESNSLEYSADTTYTKQESDTKIPFSRRENGGECIHYLSGFQWNQWWGFSQKVLDKECAKSLLLESRTSVVFMGGSSMNNREAPNYLTHIDYFATFGLDSVRSINLSEDGARHKNMSIRFQREVIPLKPKIVFFLEGFNEFNSIKYNGSPADDFYWTAGVKNRVHQPFRLYIDKLIEVSKFAELAFLRTGLYESARVMRGAVSDESVFSSADFYLEDIKVTRNICEANKIKCFFLLQPQVFGSSIPEHKEIIDQMNKSFPSIERVHLLGYGRIREGCKECIDLSDLFKDSEFTFYDAAHFRKKGSEILGNKMRSLILNSESKAK